MKICETMKAAQVVSNCCDSSMTYGATTQEYRCLACGRKCLGKSSPAYNAAFGNLQSRLAQPEAEGESEKSKSYQQGREAMREEEIKILETMYPAHPVGVEAEMRCDILNDLLSRLRQGGNEVKDK